LGIFSRLNSVLNSYINEFVEEKSQSSPFRYKGKGTNGDPDLDAAFEELNDYLNNGTNNSSKTSGETDNERFKNHSDSKLPPDELRADFAELEVPFGASAEECKAAYKKLLKIHHPDRHASHDGNYKKATKKAARINAAIDRIEKWRSEN